MEDADGFVRTLPDSADVGLSDDDSSELMFGSDDEVADGKPSAPFFEERTPAGWDLSDARKEAATLRPFQTSIDEKIRGALGRIGADAAPPSADDGLNKQSEKNGFDQGKTRDQNSEETNHGEEGDSYSESDTGEQTDAKPKLSKKSKSKQNKEPETDTPKAKKGRKRLRKEKAAAKTFDDLFLSKPLQKAVDVLEWTQPTPIQASAIPYILAGRDVCGSAVTGSGKTGAFVLPVLERLLQAGIDNSTRVIILLPTRELAAQCHSVVQSLAKYTSIRAALAVGGLSNKAQEVALRTHPHIIVATPGRLIDHMRNAHSFSLDDIEVLIMDEADRLLEMGFQAEVEQIVDATPSARQTLLFSATMNTQIKGLIKLSLQNPMNLNVDPMFDVAATLCQEFVKLRPAFENNKDALLFSLVTRTFKTRTIVFFRQKVTAHHFKILFGLTKLKAAELHGNLTQSQRLAALDNFREGSVDFLLCTDLAARGLDIAGVETVINYDMPGELKEYVHRVGRTARAGSDGRACSIVRTGSNDERKLLKSIGKRAQGKLVARVVPPAVIGKWRAWLDNLQPALKAVVKEEKQEKEMRLAEMELNKANNLMKHSDQIYARPARTWFQTEGEKMDEKAKARLDKGLPESAEEKSRRFVQQKKAFELEKRKRKRELADREESYSKQRADAKKSKRKKSRRR
ncbi:DEAD-box ATP-dependent RNA helicase 28 [Gracilariopsis chorda]|uniref:DEAD-box ATP-dependent RNA helicase 28 n=1 Tax=Gracilariopsis chorda TaxID=448386 RepID=A0A2V3IGG3_9FLOR|nr:DEAD-box ATP-dependent RNA helicase 28 [Gracilariopsis chorda]|eukprot:PXF40240.1 DEAD-box ATP-dependent RNA helicase 28 [Gracilariopsis chorda]